MNTESKKEKLSIEHAEIQSGDNNKADDVPNDLEYSGNNDKSKKLIVTQTQARWLGIVERIAQWLHSLFRRSK